ncbi:unnamed protein product, partial [Prorocentrum cordatum]
MAPSGHQQHRIQNAHAWLCRWCTNEKTGERWWNMADCTFCKSCKVAKGAAYFGPRPAGGNGANAAQAPRPLAAERRAAAEGERLKKEAAAKDREIQELKEAVRGVAAVDSPGADKPAGPEADKAVLERLTAAIGDAPDELLASHKAAMVAEQERLRAKILAGKPIGARLHLLTNRCTALEKKKERQLAALDKLHAQIQEIQLAVADAEKALLETSKELVAAEADRRSAAALAPRPEAGVFSLKATIPALDLSVSDVGKMLEAVGADASLAESIQANFAKLRELDAAAAERGRTQERAAAAEPPTSAAASSAGSARAGAADLVEHLPVPADDGDLDELQAFYRVVFDAEPAGSEEELRGHIMRFGEQLSRVSK